MSWNSSLTFNKVFDVVVLFYNSIISIISMSIVIVKLQEQKIT